MKFALASDLHLEFGDIMLKNTEKADVLVLSGDICVAKDLNAVDNYEILGTSSKSNRYHNFFQNCCEEFKNVIYVMGNHEYYHGDFAKSFAHIKEKLAYLTNLHIMEKEFKTFDSVTFIAGTLWTDMNKEDPLTLSGIKSYMNDYRIIEDSSEVVHYRDADGNSHTRVGKFTPEKSVDEHKSMLMVIDEVTKDIPNGRFVVVGHHSPSKLSTKPQYEHDTLVNGAYSSDLSEFILDRPQIKYWVHGHCHDEFSYCIGHTKIECNPRGYVNYEDIADKFKLKYFEV
jgi:DNA repair exonuclease SbcCD nuclease subunit